MSKTVLAYINKYYFLIQNTYIQNYKFNIWCQNPQINNHFILFHYFKFIYGKNLTETSVL